MKSIQILLALALFNAARSENLTDAQRKQRSDDNYNYCKDFPYRSLKEIATDLDERRANRDNHFFGRYVKAYSWFMTEQNEQLIYASRGPTAVVIIYIIVAFIIFILLILALAKVFKTNGSRTCLILAVICWVIYSCFFWAALTLQAQSAHAREGVYCSKDSLTHNFLYGNAGTPEAYIGMQNEISLMTNFQTEIDNIGGQSASITALNNADFTGTSDTVMNKVDNFISVFGNLQTSNPYGVQQVPISNQQVNQNISRQIEQELIEFYDIANGMQNSLNWASSLTAPGIAAYKVSADADV